jgi:hypothetical protein
VPWLIVAHFSPFDFLDDDRDDADATSPRSA